MRLYRSQSCQVRMHEPFILNRLSMPIYLFKWAVLIGFNYFDTIECYIHIIIITINLGVYR